MDAGAKLGDENLVLFKQVINRFVPDFSFQSRIPVRAPLQKSLTAAIHVENLVTLESIIPTEAMRTRFKGQKIGNGAWLSSAYFSGSNGPDVFRETDFVTNLRLRLLETIIPVDCPRDFSCRCSADRSVNVHHPDQAFHFLCCPSCSISKNARHDGIVDLLKRVINQSCEEARLIDNHSFWNEKERGRSTADLAVEIAGVKYYVDVTVRANGAPSYLKLDPEALGLRAERDKALTYAGVSFEGGMYCTFAVDMFGNLGPQARKFLDQIEDCSSHEHFKNDFFRSLSVWMALSTSENLVSYSSRCLSYRRQ